MAGTETLKRGDLRQALIDFALSEAEAGHIETISLRAASRALGVSSGAVYRHFEDRDALLIEVAGIGFERLKHRFLEIRPEGDMAPTPQIALSRCRRTTNAYIRFALENAALWRMMFGRIGMLCQQKLMSDPEKMRYTPFDVLTENGADLHRLGVIAEMPSLADYRFIWSATHGAAQLVLEGVRQDSDRVSEVIDDTSRRALKLLGVAPETLDALFGVQE
ncbi:MAG: TetR/AcrR family transcriptional regulator [Pseudomonadota bacterium]